MMAANPIDYLVAGMPDVVKLTIVGLAVDLPTLDSRAAEPTFVMALDHLVALGIAVASIVGPIRTYRLTMFGVEVYEVVKTMQPSDATLPANDIGFESPDDAA